MLIVRTSLAEYDGGAGNDMGQTYTAVFKEDARWWIGWIKEVPGVIAKSQHERRSWRAFVSL